VTISDDSAARFAQIALGHVTREYPNKPEHTVAGPQDARTPSSLHPVFYGSFDWHSCVHSYWMLARLLRLFPAMAPASAIAKLFNRQVVAEKIAGECAYLAAPTARGFKRPYGWGWLLKLAAEFLLMPDRRWAAALAPLAELFAQRFRDFLPLATYPVRVGTHFNTAFALRMAADYAEGMGDEGFFALLRDTAERWYGDDQDCPAWGEPSGDDFLSATLIEAECMRRLLPEDRFSEWFESFLPRLDETQPAVLFSPATVSDRSDGKIAHLDGLNLSRAWCWRSLAAHLPAGDPRRPMMLQVADRHLAAGLPHISGDYMGEHWLATYAVMALSAV
jgi:hypothetical protein